MRRSLIPFLLLLAAAGPSPSFTNGTFSGTLGVTGAATFSGGGTLTGSFAGGTFTGTTLTTPTINGGALSGTFTGAHTYSGATTLSGGGTLSGTFAGTPTWSGEALFSTAGTSIQNTAGDLLINPKDASHFVTTTVGYKGPFFKTPGNTTTLSGSTVPSVFSSFAMNFNGSSTVTGDTSLNMVNIGSASDAVSIPNGTLNYLGIISNTAAGFDGGRGGVLIQLNLAGATTLSKSGNGLVSGAFLSIGSANAGGTTTGFGTSNFGLGSLFGANAGTRMTAGGTFYTQAVAFESDTDQEAGSSVGLSTGFQLAHVATHSVPGTVLDAAFRIADQVSVLAPWRDALMLFGSYDSLWPLSTTSGYLFQVRGGGTNPAGAGGFDLNQFAATGASGVEGGGFMWRSPGLQLKDTEAQIGYASIKTNANGALIDTLYSQMATAAGSITVGAGGSGYTTGDIACDAYGDCVKVTAAAGAVTGVSSVTSRGWQTSPPADPVAFTSRSRNGAALGTGLTLNLIGWTAKHQVQIGSLTSDVVLGGATQLGALNATAGFAHLPFTNATSGAGGIPTGTPGNTNGPACVWNDVTFVLNCYSPSAGAWKHASFTAGAG